MCSYGTPRVQEYCAFSLQLGMHFVVCPEASIRVQPQSCTSVPTVIIRSTVLIRILCSLPISNARIFPIVACSGYALSLSPSSCFASSSIKVGTSCSP